MIVAISGIRDLSMKQAVIVATKMRALVRANTVTEFRCGGARGTDVIALQEFSDAHAGWPERPIPRRVVYLPARRIDQPRSARELIDQYADHVIELGFDPAVAASYHVRNRKMLLGVDAPVADILIAFIDNREKGGTRATIADAYDLRIKTETVRV